MRVLHVVAFISYVTASPFTLSNKRWQAPSYNTPKSAASQVINVHVQPHSHCDLGWLKTFDEYLIGANNSIQAASVQSIFDSVLNDLSFNPNRTFHLVEVGFLMRYLEARPASVTTAVQNFLKSGQLTTSNGGWVMPDEASGSWLEMADALSLGHRLLANVLGPNAIPRVGWQIDPFGHSAVSA